MIKPILKIHNTETNEVIDREMTDAEFVEYRTAQEKVEADALEAATKAAQRQALLTRLGITEDEARLLLG